MRKAIILTLLSTMAFILSFNSTGIINSIFTIQHDLNLSITAIQWVVSIYMLTISALILLGGIFSDRLSYKIIFITSATAFLLASTLLAFSGNIYSLLLARFLQGASAAFMMPCSLAILSSVYHTEKGFGMAVGIWSGISLLGFALGPTVAGYILNLWNWHILFLLNLPFGLVVVIGCYIVLSNNQGSAVQKSMGTLDIVLLTFGLFVFFIPTIQGSVFGWLTFKTLFLFAVGALLLSFFCYRQLKEKHPIIDFTLFKQSAFTMSVMGMLLNAILLMLVLFFFNKFIQHSPSLHYSPQQAGIALFPMGISIFFVSLLISEVTERAGYRLPICFGFTLWLISFIMFYCLRNSTTFLYFLMPLILSGIATGICYSSFPKLGINLVSQEQAGEASGLIIMANYFGSSLAISLGGIVYNQTHHHLSFLSKGLLETISFANIMILGGIIAGLCILLCFCYLPGKVSTTLVD
jgi:EmrB/QacA subfamily drug resistance transporter